MYRSAGIQHFLGVLLTEDLTLCLKTDFKVKQIYY